MKYPCYLCGEYKDNMTKDHIPPKGFFPNGKRLNLITVDCCDDCHKPLTKNDEAFRIFASALINRSSEGSWIWENKVMSSSFKRSSKLKENVKKSIVKTNLTLADGTPLSALTLDVSRAELFLIRLTKGLIRYHYPNKEYLSKKYEVSKLNPSKDLTENTLSLFLYADVVGGVFRYWRAFYDEADLNGFVWVYVFYDGVMFMVEVD